MRNQYKVLTEKYNTVLNENARAVYEKLANEFLNCTTMEELKKILKNSPINLHKLKIPTLSDIIRDKIKDLDLPNLPKEYPYSPDVWAHSALTSMIAAIKCEEFMALRASGDQAALATNRNVYGDPNTVGKQAKIYWNMWQRVYGPYMAAQKSIKKQSDELGINLDI